MTSDARPLDVLDALANLATLDRREREQLRAVDAAEIFDVVVDEYAANGALRASLAMAGDAQFVADERFVDLALRSMRLDPQSACRLLAAHPSRRALEELVNIVDVATHVDVVVEYAAEALAHRFLIGERTADVEALDVLERMVRSPLMAQLGWNSAVISAISLFYEALNVRVGHEARLLHDIQMIVSRAP